MWDLSHTITDGMPTYPGDPVVETLRHATIDAAGFNLTAVGLSSHTGTHVDAPDHVEPGGPSITAFPVDRFRYAARVVDCRVDASTPITVDRLPPADGADLLLFHTGWDAHWGEERYWEHPFLTPACARECAARDVDVGIDAPSVDGPDAHLGAHHELLRQNRLIIENLRGLGDLPGRVTVYAFPLPLSPGDGAPARVVAAAEGAEPDGGADRPT
jgi:kynurenine formamidase